MISDKYINWRTEGFSPYEDIKLDTGDYKILSSLSENSELFSKLHQITEYRLALQLAKGNISLEEFKWAMKYAEYLKGYFN